jgi:hypothetical protein
MKLPLVLGVSGVLALLAACSGASLTGFTDDAGGGSGSSSGGGTASGSGGGGSFDTGDGSAPSLGGSTTSGGEDGGGCSAASQLVYVLSTDNAIYSFDPPTKTFTKVSTLSCSAGSMSPNSMAVDRQGNAWVNYVEENPITGLATNGSIFKVDIATGACTATNIKLTDGWYQVGMGYSTASATDTTDTLYVAATNSGGLGCLGGGGGGGIGGAGSSASTGLASIDTDAGTLTKIGSGFTGTLAGQSAELTGTGDGRLYGFFVLSPVEVAQISKTTGAASSPITMPGVACPQAWAFSFWGGDFYLYTAAKTTSNSSVTHYTVADGGIDTSYVSNVGFTIVGAGVSTCAPTTPPGLK